MRISPVYAHHADAAKSEMGHNLKRSRPNIPEIAKRAEVS
jgi:hypothetical protein